MDDQTLIQKVAAGDMPAIRQLIEQNKNLIWHIIVSVTGRNSYNEDLFQDILLRIFKNSRSFRGQSKLSTWIGSIAHHVCVDYMRRRKIESGIWDPSVSPKVSGTHVDFTGRAMEKEDIDKILRDGISRLPAEYRTVITLYHLEECPYKEIAEITGMPEGTVKSYISRGRSALREMLTEAIPDLSEILSDY